ncbi:hypothetical protein LIS04_101 [Listeria phage LIS04]|nr:hypothetical protein LIS04_101 [Listeria phage LIS04]
MKNFLASSGIDSQLRFIEGRRLEWVEPEAVKDLTNNQYYTIRKESLRSIHKLIKFVKVATSKELFKKSPRLWRALLAEIIEDQRDPWNNAQFVVIDNEVIALVSEESDIATPQFFDNLGELDPDKYTVLYSYEDKRFQSLIYDKTKISEGLTDGLIIDLNVPKRSLKIWDAQITFGEANRVSRITPVPTPVVEGKLTLDLFTNLEDISSLVDKSSASSIVRYLDTEFNTHLSVAEVFKYYKKAKCLLKGKDIDKEVSKIDSAIERIHVDKLLSVITENQLQFSRLKRLYPVAKASTILPLTFNDILDMYSQLAVSMDDSSIKLSDLPEVISYSTSGKVHFRQVSQSSQVVISE